MYSANDLFFNIAFLFYIGLLVYICYIQHVNREKAIQKGLQKIRQDITIDNRLKTSRILLNRCRLRKCKKDRETKDKTYEFIELDRSEKNDTEANENEIEEEEDYILFETEDN